MNTCSLGGFVYICVSMVIYLMVHIMRYNHRHMVFWGELCTGITHTQQVHILLCVCNGGVVLLGGWCVV